MAETQIKSTVIVNVMILAHAWPAVCVAFGAEHAFRPIITGFTSQKINNMHTGSFTWLKPYFLARLWHMSSEST